jgi:fumarylacetoacetase
MRSLTLPHARRKPSRRRVDREECAAPNLNGLMSLGRPAAYALRRSLVALLRSESRKLARGTTLASRILVAADSVEMVLPADIGDYTDFYASIEHATNVGSMFRPDNQLLPNYKWVPIGYHGRASSVVVSGTDVRRPRGHFATARWQSGLQALETLDYELEIGTFVATAHSSAAIRSMMQSDILVCVS